MSGISLQQSILMNKNRSMNESLNDHKNAISQWKEHTRILEIDLRKQTKLLELEKIKSKALGEKADALGEKADLHQNSADSLEKAVLAKLEHSKEMRKNIARLERGLLLAKDKLSRAEKARIAYSHYTRALYARLTRPSAMGRSEGELRVLSGMASLEGELTGMGAEAMRFNGIAETEKELKDGFKLLAEFGQKERKTKGIHERKLHMRKAGMGAGFGAAGDLYKKGDPAYIGFPRATNRVMVKKETIREIAIRAIAWAEYQFFLDSNHEKAFLGVQTKLNTQIEQGLQAMLQASATGQHEEVIQLVQTMQAHQQDIKQWQLTLHTLRQDARPFIVERIKTLGQELEFYGDNDPQSDKEWYPKLESLSNAGFIMHHEGEEKAVSLLTLGLEDKEALMETTGVNRIFEQLNEFFSDSHNYKNKQYTLKNGAVVPIVDDSLKPSNYSA